MNTYTIVSPERLNVTVPLPASKSISNRALIIYALTGCQQLPDNLSDCDDTDVIIKALRDMPEVIDIMAAGTAMRFMTALLAATPQTADFRTKTLDDRLQTEDDRPKASHLLTGTERMKHRPIKLLVDALRHLGADISYAGEEGFPPLRISGRQLEGGLLEVAGSISSQYISALLLIGPMLKNGLTLRLKGDVISRPYIDLTLWTMKEFGAVAEWTGVDTIEVKPQGYTPRPYLVENDWSAASYWYEMVALSKDPEAEVRLEGLMDGSRQGDSSVRYIFSLLGVKTKFENTTAGIPTTVTLRKSGHCVSRLEYDFSNAPDLAQTIVCTCCALGVPFHFTGLQTLKIKETDRIEALKTEMLKLGFVLTDIDGRELVWNGDRSEFRVHSSQLAARSSTVNRELSTVNYQESIDTYEDHRMALAFAPLSLIMPISINHPQVVTKSYPHFWNHLREAGFTIVQS